MKRFLFLATLIGASISHAQPSIPLHGFLTGEAITSEEDIVISLCTSATACSVDSANYCEVQRDVDVDSEGFFLIFIGDGVTGDAPCGGALVDFENLPLDSPLSVGIRAGGEDFGPFSLGNVQNALAVGGIRPEAIQTKVFNEVVVSQGDDVFDIIGSASPNTTIRLGPGSFSSSEAFILPEGVSVVGAGRTQTTFEGAFVISGGRSAISDMTIIPPDTQFALTVESDTRAPIERSEVQIKNVSVQSTALPALVINGEFDEDGASLEVADCDFELNSSSVAATIRITESQGKITIRDSFVSRKGSPRLQFK